MTPEERFWAKVDRRGDEDCWPWTGALDSRGRYGQFMTGGRLTRRRWQAHRFALALTNGVEPPADLVACHSCDNPPCVNPAHLFLATQADNLADMWRKGRGHDGTNAERGEKRHNAKLDPAKVRAIREKRSQGSTLASLADEYGVHWTTVRSVVLRQQWKHVT